MAVAYRNPRRDPRYKSGDTGGEQEVIKSKIEQFIKSLSDSIRTATTSRVKSDIIKATVSSTFDNDILKSYTDYASRGIDAISNNAIINESTPAFTGLNTTINRLIATLKEEDEEERPSYTAFSKAFDLLEGAYRYMSDTDFPKAAVSTNRHDVHVMWTRGIRHIHLVIPAQENKQPYIYHEEHNDFAIDHRVTDESLANWLIWYTAL